MPLCLCAFLLGCSGTIHPPINPIDPVAIYVPDYGRHSSIVLPDPHGGYVEWAFGDWNWFALGHTKWYDAIGAVLVSPQSTLARRVIVGKPNDDLLKGELGADKLLRFDVSKSDEQKLMDALDARYLCHADTQVYSDYSLMDHVEDSEFYFGLHNCNALTARWLRQMGCEVDGLTILSKFKLGSPR